MKNPSLLLPVLFLVTIISCAGSPGRNNPSSPPPLVEKEALVPSMADYSSGDAQKLAFKNFVLLPGIAAYEWTSFQTVPSEDKIKIFSKNDYRLITTLGETKQPFAQGELLLTKVKYLVPEDKTPPSGNLTVTLSNPDTIQKENLLNSLLMEAAKESGRSSGWLRVKKVELTPEGLSAEIETR